MLVTLKSEKEKIDEEKTTLEGILQFKVQESNQLTQLVGQLRETQESNEEEIGRQKKFIEILTAERDRLSQQNKTLKETSDIMKHDSESQIAKLKEDFETMMSN